MMNWDCNQLEERLNDFLDGRLPAAEAAEAEAHARACPRCAEWLDARQAAGWLRRVETLEAPPGLETRILALTVSPPEGESFWATLQSGWRLLLAPRFGLGVAAALFSLALVVNALGLSGRDLRASDLHPVNLYRTMDRQAHQSYAWGVRFVNDLRLVYEIRSRLEELQPEAGEPPAAAPASAPAGSQPKSEKKQQQTPSNGTRSTWLVAWQSPGGPGAYR